VNQREVGLDTKSFARALRSAVRAAPDVILIGEIRDRETMEAAISLAGTGHLCIATLHANNCAETLDRIINMFPRDQHNQIFLDLSQYLRAILSQRLVPAKSGVRGLAACEVMVNTPHISELIKVGDVVGVKEAIRTGTERGMLSFDSSLYNLVREGRIELEEALTERRFAHQSRSEDQLWLRMIAPGRMQHKAPPQCHSFVTMKCMPLYSATGALVAVVANGTDRHIRI
jgi:twitching motility protein PilU